MINEKTELVRDTKEILSVTWENTWKFPQEKRMKNISYAHFTCISSSDVYTFPFSIFSLCTSFPWFVLWRSSSYTMVWEWSNSEVVIDDSYVVDIVLLQKAKMMRTHWIMCVSTASYRWMCLLTITQKYILDTSLRLLK